MIKLNLLMRIVYVNADSDNVTFLSDDMDFVNVDLHDISLHDDDDDAETLLMLDLWLGVMDKSTTNYVKKDKQIMSVAWQSTICGTGACQKMKKEANPFLINEK